MAKSRLSVSFLDYDEEVSIVSIDGPEFETDGSDFVLMRGYQETLRTAIKNVSLGTEKVYHETYSTDLVGVSPPEEQGAQRELKWLVLMHDAVNNKKLRIQIPCADTSLLDDENRQQMDMDAVEWTALKAAIEAYAESPYGNAVVVDKAILVGRNL